MYPESLDVTFLLSMFYNSSGEINFAAHFHLLWLEFLNNQLRTERFNLEVHGAVTLRSLFPQILEILTRVKIGLKLIPYRRNDAVL